MKILLGNKKFVFFLFAFLFYLAAYNQKKKKKDNSLLFGAFFEKRTKKIQEKRYKYKPVRDKIIVKNKLFHIPTF